LTPRLGAKRSEARFDFVISNPPYQEDSGTRQKNQIYHRFILAANNIADQVCVIHPAGWVKGGIRLNVAKDAWKNEKNLKSIILNEYDVFDDVSIGSTTITYFDNRGERFEQPLLLAYDSPNNKTYAGNYNFDDVEFYPQHDDMLYQIIQKVRPTTSENSCAEIVSAQRNLGVEGKHFKNAFDAGHSFSKTFDTKHSTKVLVSEKLLDATTKEDFYYINITNPYWEIRESPDINKWKVAFKATGNKQSQFNWVLAPGELMTDKFLMVGFNNRIEAENYQKYLKTKFYQITMLPLLVDQNALRKTHRNTPIQNFTNQSDIDWSKSISEIDQQLYKKYNLNQDEIDFIETKVKTMN